MSFNLGFSDSHSGEEEGENNKGGGCQEEEDREQGPWRG